MNRKTYIIGLLAFAMLAASCKKEEKQEAQEGFSITASTESDGSKTYLDGYDIKWTKNDNHTDKIDVWDQTAAEPVVFTCKEVYTGGISANFTCSNDNPIDNKGKYWAFYPSGGCSTFDKGNNAFTFSLPATQTCGNGKAFPDDVFPMAAHFSTGAKSGVNMQFKNACGFLKIHATGNTQLTAIRVTDNNTGNNALSGNFTFNPVTETTTAAGSNGNEITLNISPAVDLNDGAKDFYMILPPGSLSGDFTVDFINGNTTVKSASGSNQPIGRSKVITANTSINVITSLTGTTQAISSSPVNWAANDKIKVYDKSGDQIEFTCAASGTSSNFTCSSGSIDDKGEYWAFYPQTVNPSLNTSTNTFSFTMPSSQNYVSGGTFQRDLLPMAVHYSGTAGSTDITLPFQNAFGVLKISVTGNMSINKIKLTDNSRALYGNFNMNLTDSENPTVTSANNSINHTLTLNINPAVTLTDAEQYFYMILPPGCLSSNSTVEFFSGNDDVHPVKSVPVSDKTILRSTMQATATMDVSKVYYFQVDASGTKVEFASGNLKHDSKGWGFFTNDYDFYRDQRDLFYYSNDRNNNYGLSYVAEGNYIDWGNVINNGNDGWRVLTAAEWHYIIDHNTHNEATVNGKPGAVFLPTNWDGNYNLNNWADMKAHGAVFLPNVGAGMYLPEEGGFYLFNNLGIYWCASYNSTDENTLYLYNEFFTQRNGQGYIRSVRLAKNVIVD